MSCGQEKGKLCWLFPLPLESGSQPKGVAPGRQSWGRELSEDTLLLVTLLPMNIFWGLEFYL